MLDTVVAIAIVVLLVVGFYLTRGGGGVPGGTDDPAFEEVRRRFSQFGEPAPRLGEEHEDREHQVE